MVQAIPAGAPTLRTCLETFALDPPGFYVGGLAYQGGGAWEAGRLIAHLLERDGGKALLARPVAIFEYYEDDPAALRATAVAGIYLLREDGRVEQEEGSSITVYRLFSLARFRASIVNATTGLLQAEQQRQGLSPLLAYAGSTFGISLEMWEDPTLLYYRRKGGTASAGFPLWAILLHKLLAAIRGVDETAAQAVDWQKTVLALLPLVEQLALHTDWPTPIWPIAGGGRE